MQILKQELYDQCCALIKEKRNQIEEHVTLLQTSLSSESKSTAGDKHETGRAMIQLEREKLGNQLKQLELQERSLGKIQTKNNSDLVVLGSYVKTDSMNYYLSISLGKIEMNGIDVYAISTKSPIGSLLLGKKVGDQIIFNEKRSLITAIN